MKQHGDVRTVEIEAFPVPKRRGRPPSGSAKSASRRVMECNRRKAGALSSELEALRLEVARLAGENARLFRDNQALAIELARLRPPEDRLLSALAAPLAAFFDEVGIRHGLAGGEGCSHG